MVCENGHQKRYPDLRTVMRALKTSDAIEAVRDPGQNAERTRVAGGTHGRDDRRRLSAVRGRSLRLVPTADTIAAGINPD
ncbi:hypothetical protein [Lysobacter sp. Hz 25]|uniref:hypothetical protein n=1 Tax=Lysobacter sp. Hz 25 TaxID=3383698 RepID=UPI0038D46DD8